MNGKTATALLLLVFSTLAVSLVSCNRAPKAPVHVTLRLSVKPAGEMDFVIGQASSAKLKYEVGKKAGVKPAFAQRLVFKPMPNTALLEVQAGVGTKAEGQRFAEAFLEALRTACGNQAEVSLVDQTIR